MNELMIVLSGNSWLYFMTNKRKISEAFDEFEEHCVMNGINIDNLEIEQMVLRDNTGYCLDAGGEG